MLRYVRLLTIHPALVHFTIGALPIFVIAYGVAAWRRSQRWTFAADVAVVIAATITLATVAFGLVSNAIAPWPGGLETWRWLHLGFGIASAVLLLLFAVVRLFLRRDTLAGPGTAALSLAIALIVAFTGWIGGEILVFHAGMAVDAAAEGALAPPTPHTDETPRDLVDSMGKVRARWADAVATLASDVVQRPTSSDLDRIANDARAITRMAAWIRSHGAETLDEPNAPVRPHAEETERVAGHEASGPMGTTPGAAGETRAQDLAEMAADLMAACDRVEAAASERDLPRLALAVGELSAQCAGCHEHLRWEAPAQRPGRLHAR